MGSVWCRSVSCCSSWLIMSGTSNGCLRYGRVAFHKTKAPKLFKDSLNSKWVFFSFSFLFFSVFFLNYYFFFSQSWVKVIPGWKFGALHVWFRQTDLCQQKKRKKESISLAAALFSISDPLNIISAFFCFTYALGVQCICGPPCDSVSCLLTSAPWSPHFLLEVGWIG